MFADPDFNYLHKPGSGFKKAQLPLLFLPDTFQ